MDRIFEPLYDKYKFTLEGCADYEGLNTHKDLPFCSVNESVLERDLAGERVYIHPPWHRVEQIAAHFEQCRKANRNDTLGVFILPA